MPVRSAAFVLSVVLAAGACAQSDVPAVFVANNGNLEGSVSSFVINSDGTVTFRDKVVTGSRPNTQVYHPGTNAQCIDLTPDGRFLATGHGTSSSTVEQLTIIRVHPDQTLEIVGIFQTPDSPLHLAWINDEYLAVCRTGSGSNGVYVYRFDPDAPGGPTLTTVDIEVFGAFTARLAVHPSRELLYAQSSLGDSRVFSFAVNPNGTLTALDNLGTGNLPLGIGISPNGRFLYAGGGISGDGRTIVGLTTDKTGDITFNPNGPWTSPGVSPKQVVVTKNNDFAIVAHGTDSSVRSFAMDPNTGDLVSTGFGHIIGIQGSVGDIATMGDLVFACDRDTINDGVRGLVVYTLGPNGELTQNGPTVDTTGIAPNALALWKPPCPGDTDGDGVVDFTDFSAVLSQYGQMGAGLSGDLNGDGVVDFADFSIVLANYGTAC